MAQGGTEGGTGRPRGSYSRKSRDHCSHGETSDPSLNWDGCFNVRDLGGLPTVDGRCTRWGAVVRGDSLDCLSARGWHQLEAHGVRAVIDLRNEDEWGEDVAAEAGLAPPPDERS